MAFHEQTQHLQLHMACQAKLELRRIRGLPMLHSSLDESIHPPTRSCIASIHVHWHCSCREKGAMPTDVSHAARNEASLRIVAKQRAFCDQLSVLDLHTFFCTPMAFVQRDPLLRPVSTSRSWLEAELPFCILPSLSLGALYRTHARHTWYS